MIVHLVSAVICSESLSGWPSPSPQADLNSISEQRTQELSQGVCIDVSELWPTEHSEVVVRRTEWYFYLSRCSGKGINIIWQVGYVSSRAFRPVGTNLSRVCARRL
jgi:hypothetical protein